MKAVDTLIPHCKFTICGGYRRGKDESNDVDIVITHHSKTLKQISDLLTNLKDKLKKSGELFKCNEDVNFNQIITPIEFLVEVQSKFISTSTIQKLIMLLLLEHIHGKISKDHDYQNILMGVIASNVRRPNNYDTYITYLFTS